MSERNSTRLCAVDMALISSKFFINKNDISILISQQFHSKNANEDKHCLRYPVGPKKALSHNPIKWKQSLVAHV